MQQADNSISRLTRKAQEDIAKSFVKKAAGIISKKVNEPKTIKEGLNQTFIEIQKEGVSLKRIEKTFLEIDKNIRAFRILTLGVLALSSLEIQQIELKRAGKRQRPTASRIEEKQKPKKQPGLIRLLFTAKVKKRPPTRLKSKPRPPRKKIKASARKRIFNRKLRNALTRLKAKIAQRSAKLRGLQRYRASVEASRVQRRLERLRFKQEARLTRERLISEQNRRIAQAESDSKRITNNADAEARRIRASADADAKSTRANAQNEAARRIAIAEEDAKRITSESQTRAKALISDVEAQSRQRITAANLEVNNAAERVQQINDDIRKLEVKRQQSINGAAEAQRVVREARAELARVQKDTTVAAADRDRIILRQQELIKEFDSTRVFYRDQIASSIREQDALKAQILEAEGRVSALRSSAESLELNERRRIQSLVSGGEVPVRPTGVARIEPETSRISRATPVIEAPPRVVTETAERLVNQSTLTRREIQAIVGERNVQPPPRQVAALLRPPVAPPVKPVESVKRAKQIAVLLSRPPVIPVSQNILTSSQKVILQNSAQKAISRIAVSVVSTISKKLPAIGLFIGAGFTIKSAVIDKTKVGTALNAYATLTPSFIAALATIYPLTINEVYKDEFEIYPEYDPDPSWLNKLVKIHVLLYDELQAAIKKMEETWYKTYNDLGEKWKRDLEFISNRGVGPFIGRTFDLNKLGPRAERERQRLMRDTVISSDNMNQAIMRAATLIGVDPRVLHTIAMIESSGGKNLKNPNSSASGLFQFTSGTWADMKRRHPRFKDILDKGPIDFDASAIAAALYIQDNSKILQRNGVPLNVETLYAAHFLGPGSLSNGAVALYKLLETNPNDPAEKYFQAAASSNKEIFYRKVRGQLAARTIAEVVQVLRDKISGFASSSESAFPTVGTGNEIQRTSEAIQNNPTLTQTPTNIVVVSNNTNFLGAKGKPSSYSSQNATVG